MLRIAGLLSIAALLLALCGCPPKQPETPGATPASSTESIKVNGSDTMVNLGAALAEAFSQNTGTSVEVTGGGSGTGIKALIDGLCDITQASREMKPEEIAEAKAKGVEPHETQVAWDGVAVIVNPASPVDRLTIDQLADIFTGRETNWAAFGGPDKNIVVLSRETSSGTHVYFKEHVLNKGDSKGKDEYAATARMQQSSQTIHDEVKNNDQAIGYVGLGYVDPEVKALKVAVEKGDDAVAPTPANVISGAYPISRPLYVYTNGEPSGVLKAYVDFCLSPAGQEIVSREDFVPLEDDAA